MAISPYLAMTAEEIAQYEFFPNNTAFLCCPFSDQNPIFPDCDFLVLTDSTPVDWRFANHVLEQLRTQNLNAVILDFQRPDNKGTTAFISMLLEQTAFPVYVSDLYATGLDCGVFLPPVPLHRRLSDHIAPWKGKDICLDISAQAERIRVTADGSTITSLPRFSFPDQWHHDPNLHCHYATKLSDDAAEFTLWRTEEDIHTLLEEAESLGIQTAAGLWQELGALL